MSMKETIKARVLRPWEDLGMRFYVSEVIHLNAAEVKEAKQKGYDLVGVGLYPYHHTPLAHVELLEEV